MAKKSKPKATPRAVVAVVAPYKYSETVPVDSGLVAYNPQYPTFLQVSYTDYDGNDRTATIQALQNGDIIASTHQTWTITGTSFLADSANFGVDPPEGAGVPPGVYNFALGGELSPPMEGGPTTSVPCLLAANQSLSEIATFAPGSVVVLLIMPDGWEPATLLTIQVSVDGTNFYDATNADGSPISAQVHPGTGLLLQRAIGWAGWARLRSGSYQSPVPQLADRNFTFVTKP